MTVTRTETAGSAWAPLASNIFRALWIAQLVSNLGTWMQTVGAQWILVEQPNAATLVSLVQTATTLPVMLLSVPSGVLADLMDRRRLLIGAQTSMAVLAALLAVLTATGHTTPGALLLVLFLLGCGQALTGPAWQAIQPDLVPRSQIPAAAALSSMGMNVGRAVGPALAGALVAVTGPTTVFALNAVSFVGILVVLLRWRRPAADLELPTERPIAALQAGLRFIHAAPAIRRVLLRCLLFVAPGSALWALLPVIAHSRLNMSSSGYGLLLGALGVGAVLGATQVGRLRHRFGPSRLLAASAVGFGLATLGAAVVPNILAVLALLVIGGFGWMASMSTMNSIMQLLLPGWVRARGLSVYQLVFMGGQAIGSLVWGLIAGSIGSVDTLLIAAAMLGICALSVLWWPVRVSSIDTTPSAHWPEPVLVFEPAPEDGPVLVLANYRVPEENAGEFIEAMARVGRSRQRTGAMEWRLFRDVGHEDRYVEAFVVRSWEEHMHQHQVRLTANDELAEQRVSEFTIGEGPTRHLIAVGPPDVTRVRRR
ncbi:MFS transporter [Nocardia sp. NPDC088792]|uniref:MFS transporter n=1 Tax=Nocardia sp. NPDC088792 TaxID=3364332 RepID=UPI0038191EE6